MRVRCILGWVYGGGGGWANIGHIGHRGGNEALLIRFITAEGPRAAETERDSSSSTASRNEQQQPQQQMVSSSKSRRKARHATTVLWRMDVVSGSGLQQIVVSCCVAVLDSDRCMRWAGCEVRTETCRSHNKRVRGVMVTRNSLVVSG